MSIPFSALGGQLGWGVDTRQMAIGHEDSGGYRLVSPPRFLRFSHSHVGPKPGLEGCRDLPNVNETRKQWSFILHASRGWVQRTQKLGSPKLRI